VRACVCECVCVFWCECMHAYMLIAVYPNVLLSVYLRDFSCQKVYVYIYCTSASRRWADTIVCTYACIIENITISLKTSDGLQSATVR